MKTISRMCSTPGMLCDDLQGKKDGWHSQLVYDVCSDCPLACMACFCPCIVRGQIGEKLVLPLFVCRFIRLIFHISPLYFAILPLICLWGIYVYAILRAEYNTSPRSPRVRTAFAKRWIRKYRNRVRRRKIPFKLNAAR